MPDALDLSEDIAIALDGALASGHPVAVAYVGEDGRPSLSYRGSIHVHGPQQIALWARSADDGLAAAVAERPHVSLLYYDAESPGPAYASIKGRAHVDPSANEQVYAAIVQSERDHDPEAKGVAVIVDVDDVVAAGASGVVTWSRD